MENNENKFKNESELQIETFDIYNEIILKPEIVEALNILNSLPTNLYYHNKEHTLDVINDTILFALGDDASREVIDIQAIAAAWHDVGYTKDPKNHEAEGAKLFEQSSVYKKIPEETRKEIINNILDTRPNIINNSPVLSKTDSKFGYVLDADVSNFGRADFFEQRAKVVREIGLDWNNLESRKKFIKFALDLLANDWKTDSAKRLRQEMKEKNYTLLKEEYEQLNNTK